MPSRQDLLLQRDKDVLVIVLLGNQVVLFLLTVWAWWYNGFTITTCMFFFTTGLWCGAAMADNTIFSFPSFRNIQDNQETKED